MELRCDEIKSEIREFYIGLFNNGLFNNKFQRYDHCNKL